MMKKIQFNQQFSEYKHHINSYGLKKSIGHALSLLSILLLMTLSSPILAQHCGGAPTILAKWDFNSENLQCNGAMNVGPTPITNPSITPGAEYCPNINNGCGETVLGSVGHQNTPQYQNAICLANFYAVERILASGTGAPYDPDATTFDPLGKANLSVWYDLPQNFEGCLTSFSLRVLQRQFDGSTLNFETQGVAVKRNGVIIYNTSVPITVANVNGTPIDFTFSGDEFCSDGSERVEFEIVFGLVHRLTGPALPGQPGQTGYDDLCLNGYCKTNAFGGIIPATCSGTGPNDDAQVLIQNFELGNTYDFNEGDTYTGSATYASGSTPIPMDGLVTNFPNPINPTNYTFRIFQENCFSDFTVTLDPQYCCIVPEGSVVVASATCDGTTANDDAQITVTGVMGGSRTGISTGSTYSGPAFASANPLIGGEFTFTALPNPLVSQIYTIRVFDSATCFIDYNASIFNESCIVPCSPPNGVTLESTMATCSGSIRNPDAVISVSNVNGGDRVGMSPSITYSGPDYASASDLVNGSYTFTGINTPNGTEIYTIRVYNTSDGCYIDQTVEVEDPQCGDCVHLGAFVTETGPNTLEGDGSNNQGAFESCNNGGVIDLELTKSVSPSTGITCATTGTPFVWTLSITNAGNMTATNVNVIDLIPAGLSVTATNPSKGAFYGGSGWTVGDLAADETATLEITTIALLAGTYVNCAYVNDASPEEDVDSSIDNTESANEDDDDCATITVTGDNPPIVEKTISPKFVIPNVPTRLTFKITNNNSGPITMTNDLVDTFPSSPGQMVIAPVPNLYASFGVTPGGSGIVANAGGTSITIPTGTILEPGLNQISVDIVAPVFGDYCNRIEAGEFMTDLGDNCLATETCIKANPVFELAPIVTKRMDPENIGPGEISNLIISIENRNGDPMTLKQNFNDAFPTGLVVDGALSSTCNTATLENGNTEVQLAAGSIIAANSTCVITIPLRADNAGCYCNVINMNEVITEVGPNTDNSNEEVAEACLKVSAQAVFDLALTKIINTTATPGPYAPDSSVQFTIKVINQGTLDAYDVDVADYFDAAELSTPILVTQAGVTDNGGGSFTIDQIVAGDSVSFDVTTMIDATFMGTSIINNAEITGGSETDGGPDAMDEDSTPNNNSTTEPETDNDDVVTDNDTGDTIDDDPFEDDFDPAEVTVGQIFDLALTKVINTTATPGPFAADSSVQFTITVTNQGTLDAFDVDVSDYFNAAELSSPTLVVQSGVTDNGGGTFTIDQVAAGTSVSFDVITSIDASFMGTSIINNAEITGGSETDGGPDAVDEDSTPNNNSSSTPETDNDDVITDNETGDPQDDDPFEDDYDPAVVSIGQVFDLALVKVLNSGVTPEPIAPGSPVQFTIAVTNQGTLDAFDIEVTDNFNAAELSIPSLVAQAGISDNGAGVFTVDQLMAGMSVSFEVVATINAGFMGASITNSADITSGSDTDGGPDTTDEDPTPDDNDSTTPEVTVDQIFDLALIKVINTTATPGPFAPDSSVQFTITVTNQGTLDAFDVDVSDYFNVAELSTPTLVVQAGVTDNGGGTYTIDQVAAGSSVSFDVVSMIDGAFAGVSIINNAEITGGSETNGGPDAVDEDSTPNNNSGSMPETDNDDVITDNDTGEPQDDDPFEDDYDPAEINIGQVFDLALNKVLNSAVTPEPIALGAPIQFTITVTNQGTLDAFDVDIMDNYDNSALSTPMLVAQAGITDNGGGTFTVDQIMAGTSISFEVVATINAGFLGSSVINNAQITSASDTDGGPDSTDEDPTPDDNGSTTPEITVAQMYDLALTKGLAESGPFSPGDTVTFRIYVYNQGSVDAAANTIVVEDYVPSSMTLVDADWNVDNTYTMPNLIASGGVDSVDVDLRINIDFMGTSITNNAEIVEDGGDDEDSTPNDEDGSNPDNEDDDIDETNGDDDYDPEEIMVEQIFDLALEKKVSSTVPAIIFPGEVVTFNIEVTNQGTLDAYNIEIVDYIPAGLQLFDDDWTEVSPGTAMLNNDIDFLGVSEKQTVNITFKVEDDFMGDRIVNYAEIEAADDDNNPTNTPPTDADSTPGDNEGDDEEANDGEVVDTDTGDLQDDDPDSDDYDPAVILITQEFDLAIMKLLSDFTDSNNNNMIDPGEDVTFSVTVYNQGSLDATNIEITDYVPSDMIFDAMDNMNFSGSATMPTATIPSLVAGADTTLTITLQVNPDFMGMIITNNAEITNGENALGEPDSDDPLSMVQGSIDDASEINTDNDIDDEGPGTPGTMDNPDDIDDYDLAQIMVGQMYDLALTKGLAEDGPFSSGDTVTFRIYVYNQGTLDAAANTIVVEDYVPAGLTMIDPDWNADNTYTMPNVIAAGGVDSVDIDLRIDPDFMGSSITNNAEIVADGGDDVDSTPDDEDGSDPDDDDDDVDETNGDDDYDPETIDVVQIFDLALEKKTSSTAPTTIYPGDEITFNIEVTNQGTLDAYNIEVVDYIPVGLELFDADWTEVTAGTAMLNNEIDFLGVGEQQTVNITFKVSTDFMGDKIVNYAEIESADDDNNPNNTPPTDADSTPGDNEGDDEEANDGEIVDTDTGDLQDDDPDSDDYDPEVLLISQEFDLAIRKLFSGYTDSNGNNMLDPGEDASFEITVYNQGSLDATNVEITDYVPSDMIFNAGDNTDFSGSATMPTAMIANLASGSDSTLTIVLQVDPGFMGTIITNNAEITMGENALDEPDSDNPLNVLQGSSDDESELPTDNDIDDEGPGTPGTIDNPNDVDDYDLAQVMVGQVFDLALTKGLAESGPFNPGDTVTFRIYVYNQGTLEAAANTIVVEDYVPMEMTMVDPDWNVDNTYTMPNAIAAGGVDSVDIDLQIDPGFMGMSITNNAEIIADGGEDMDSTPDDEDGTVPDDDDDDVIETNGDDDYDPEVIMVELPCVDPILTPLTAEEICEGGNFTTSNVTTNVTNGISVTYQWYDNNGTNNPGMNALLGQTTNTLTALPTTVGEYSYLVEAINATDGSCSASETVTLTIHPNPIVMVNSPSICDGEMAMLTASLTGGTAGFSYSWSVPLGVGDPGDVASFNASIGGVYSVVVTDSNTCTASNSGTLTVNPNPTATIATPTDPTCTGDTSDDNGTITLSGFTTERYDMNVGGTYTGSATYASATLIPVGGEIVNNIANPSGSIDYTIRIFTSNDCYIDRVVTINEVICIVEIYDLALTKGLAESGPFSPGDTVTFRIYVYNQGNVDAAANTIVVEDYVPTGMTMVDADWNNDNTYTMPNLIAANGIDSVDVDLRINPDFMGATITNNAEIVEDGGDDEDSTPGDEDGSDPDEENDDVDETNGDDDYDPEEIEVDQIYDLALTKGLAEDGPFSPGDTVTFRIYVYNQGTLDAAANTIMIEDYVPTGMTMVDGDWSVDNTYILPNAISSGGVDSVDIDLRIDPDFMGLSITNNAEIVEDGGDDEDSTPGDEDGSDPDEEDDDVDETNGDDDYDPEEIKVDQIYDLALTKGLAEDGPFGPGDTVTFRIYVYNQGTLDAAANTIMIEDYVPTGMTMVDGDWSVDNTYIFPNVISSGGVDSVDVDLRIDPDFMGLSITNNAEIVEDGGDDEDSTPGDEDGSDPDEEDDDVDETNGDDDYDPEEIKVDQIYDLALVKKIAENGPFIAGDTVTFRIYVYNQGTVDAAANTIVVEDYIPDEMMSVDPDWSADNTYMMPNIIAAGGVDSVDIDVRIDPDFTGGSLTNNAEIIEDGGDDNDSTPEDEDGSNPDNQDNDIDETNGDDDYDPESIVILPPQVLDLALIKTIDPNTAAVRPGDIVTFNIQVCNQGTIPVEGVLVHDYIPAGMEMISSDSEGWNYIEESTYGFMITERLFGDECSTISVDMGILSGFTADDMINVAEIAMVLDTSGFDISDQDIDSTPNDDDGEAEGTLGSGDDNSMDGSVPNGEDSDDADPAAPPLFDLAIQKINPVVGPSVRGDVVPFEITVFNQGNMVAQNIEVTDYIPEGLEFRSSMGWTSSGSTATHMITEILPGADTTIILNLEILPSANPMNVVNMAEVSMAVDTLGIEYSGNGNDYDSDFDDNNTNDVGNDLYDFENNDELNEFGIDENGQTGMDEDDHDQAWVVLCDGMACHGTVNFSIDESCVGSLTPSMLLTGDLLPDNLYEITVKNENGETVPNMFGIGDVGSTFDVSIHNPLCAGNTCWVSVTVEYKFDPTIECAMNDTLSCTQIFDEAVVPNVSGNCVSAELIKVSETYMQLTCDDLFTGQMTRKWIAMDIFGNTSDTCTQVISLLRTNLDSIMPVQNFMLATNNAISCSSGYEVDANGHPAPSLTGVPKLRIEDGSFIDLYPFEAATICNGFVEYEDEILGGSTSCVTKILRTWIVGEWWCSQTNQREFIQIIEIVDFDGPSVSCPSDLTVSTSGFGCESYASMELPVVSDACNDEIRIDLSTPSGFYSNYSGEVIMLPAGVHELTYHNYDGCNNRTDCSFYVTVRDDADPIAICDQFTAVGIGLDGLTKVTAEAIDDGSFDECGPVSLTVARMDSPGFDDLLGFESYVDITCADVGENVMVGLLVTDTGGNTNMCMVSIEVQDKVDAKFTCPEDMVVECNFPYDPSNLGAFFGEVEIYDNCPGSNIVIDTLLGNLNSCGAGVLVRELRLLNALGEQVDYCTQQIIFESGTPLQYSDITPPISEVTVSGCGVESIDPSILGMPIVEDGFCQQTAIGIENDTFPFTENGACLKIIRTFKVIDWCIDDGPGSVLEPFEFNQIIKVNNTVGPEIEDVFADSIFCSYEVGCGAININGYLTATSTDDCTVTSDLLNRYEVRNSDGEIVRFGSGLDASGEYDVDIYTVRFYSEDKCGNEVFEESTFEVRSCKLPTPYCLQGLSTTLTAMDTLGDGTPDVEMVMLPAEFFDAGSYHPCGYEVQLSFSEDVNDTIMTFFCSDTVGLQPIELWVTDEHGGQDYCTTFVDIQDNDTIDLCGGLKPVDIAGRIYTESDAELKDAEVELRSAESLLTMTDENGIYEFANMPQGGDYQIVPIKDNDYMNGVSTLDLVIIQRHILGLAPLNSVYERIAADINNNEKITASDLIALRKMILGIDVSFPNNTSWRFIDSEHEFVNDENPWESPMPEKYNIEALSEDMQVDFIAVKTGDVNGNVDMNVSAGVVTETRSHNTLTLELPDIEVEKENLYEIDVRGSDELNIYGMQYSLDVKGLEIVGVKPGKMDMRKENTSTDNDMLHVSYASGEGDEVIPEDKLYSIIVKAKSSGQLSDMIGISSDGLDAEFYEGEGLKTGFIEIEWRDTEASSLVELFSLEGNSPNPWRSSTNIVFYQPRDGEVSLKIMDVSGRVLLRRTEEFETGVQKITLTNREFEKGGVLLYELQFEDQVVNGKMIRIE